MTRIVLLAGVLVLIAGGCGGSKAQGTVTGTVRLVGGPPPGGPQREPHARFNVLLHAKVVKTVRADARGRFTFTLPAGAYTVSMGKTTPLSPTTLHVSSGATTPLRLTIDAM